MKTRLVTSLAAALMLSVSNAFAADKPVDQLNELLRGEMSAVETYEQALEKVTEPSEAATLRSFMSDHQAAVTSIKSRVAELGGTPATDSGPWGTWAQTVTGTAKIMGDTAALKALKEGEEHGLKEHQEVVMNTNVPQEIRAEIKDKFIPKQKAHIAELDRLIDKAA